VEAVLGVDVTEDVDAFEVEVAELGVDVALAVLVVSLLFSS